MSRQVKYILSVGLKRYFYHMKTLSVITAIIIAVLTSTSTSSTAQAKVRTVPIQVEGDSTAYLEPQDTMEAPTAPYIARIEEDPAFLKLNVEGKVFSAMITEEGDTLILADLDDVSITSFREFKSDADYKKYQKFRRYAAHVFPYAKEAIRIFREVEYAEEHLKKRAYKKKVKQLEQELKAEFEEPLGRLTKLQGKIMIKMIEKELDQPMYDLLRGVKGRFTAFYWHQFSKLYSYDLKEGYQYGKYEILDAVLQDFDLSYRIENDTNLKYISLEDVRKKAKK